MKKNNIMYYTYQLKEDKPFRVVIRHLHHSIPMDEIKQALEEIKFKVSSIKNIVHPRTKSPLPLFFINLGQTKITNEFLT